jgi:hypothetical protein
MECECLASRLGRHEAIQMLCLQLGAFRNIAP